MSVRLAILGGGAWGTALAMTAIRAGHGAAIWARDPATIDAINAHGENPRYLPGIALSPGLSATGHMHDVIAGAAAILVVTPAQTLRAVLRELASHIGPGIPLILCAKGMDRETGRLLSEIAAELLPANPVAALSGPSFASDVARGLPTAVTIAADNEPLAADLAQLLSSSSFRCYSSDDLIGVQIGGALKNVLAVAAGAVSGAALGASAQAAIVTRGFVELRRIGAAFGARPETLMGLSGLGDLILSCGSAQSRNFAYGLALGRGEALEGRPLAEGVVTAGVAAKVAARRRIDAPIVTATAAILKGELTIDSAVSALLSRPLKSETE